MGLWQGAWRLARFELGTSKGGVVMTAVMFTYMAVIGMALLDDLFSGELGRRLRWAPDFIYLAMLPNMGFLLNRALTRVWQDDPYSRKLAVWRTMPISLKQIVLGRVISLVLLAIPIWLLFFGLQYGLSHAARSGLDLLEFANFSLFWLAYSYTAGMLYIYCEMGFSGRTYFTICLTSILIYVPAIYLIWLSGQTAIERVWEAASSGNWIPTLCAWAIALACLTAGRAAIERRIQSRDLLH